MVILLRASSITIILIVKGQSGPARAPEIDSFSVSPKFRSSSVDIGRYGKKARAVDLTHQLAVAYSPDMGGTSDLLARGESRAAPRRDHARFDDAPL